MADPKTSTPRRTAIRVGGAVLGLAVLAAGGVGVAGALTRPADPNASLRTAVVSRGTVQQVLPLTGSVQRVDQVKAAFPVAGTITAVNVAVGDRVQQGQVLATMDPLPLQAALLDAQAQLAQAQAQLDSDQNPTSPAGAAGAAGASGRTGAGAAGGAGAAASAAAGAGAAAGGAAAGGAGQQQQRAAQQQGSGQGGTWATGRPNAPAPEPTPAPVPESVAQLPAAMTAVHEALAAQQTACRAVLSPGTAGQSHPIAYPTPTVSPAVPTAAPSASPTPPATPTATPTGIASPTPTPTPTRTATATPLPTPTGAPTSDPVPPPSGPSQAQIAGCTDALRQLAAAEQQAANLIARAATDQQAAAQQAAAAQQSAAAQQAPAQQPAPQQPAGQLPAGGAPTGAAGRTGAAPAGTGASGAGVPTGGLPTAAPTVNQAKVATDRASVLAAEQAIAQAQSNLDAASLKAPIAGTIGAIGFTAGTAASPNAGITVIGAGAAEVTVPVPLSNRPQIQLGQEVRVNAPGSLSADPGKITDIAPLPANANASTPSYNVTVLVADPGPGLATGGRADAGVVVGQVADAVTVPVSAVTRVATGTGTVRLVEATGVREVNVGTGLVGNGLVEITGGLTAGQRVVLADSAQPLPTTQLRNLRSSQGGGAQGGGGEQAPTARPS